MRLGFIFLHCKSLGSIDFPSTLRRVGYAAFQGCTSLPQITLPPSLVEIGSSAFRACTKLKKVNINNMFKLIVVFNECSSLQRYNFETISMRLENILPAGSRSQMGTCARSMQSGIHYYKEMVVNYLLLPQQQTPKRDMKRSKDVLTRLIV